MSIIQEALKKAQQNYMQNTVSQKEAIQTDSAEEATVSSPPKHIPLPLSALIPGIIILVILAGLGLRTFFLDRPHTGMKNAVSHQEVTYQKTEAKAPAAGDIISPIKKALLTNIMAQPPEFILNGIMYLQEGPQAIINSTVVRTGDMISGAIVKTINRNNVLLDFNDTEIALTLKE